MKQVVVVGGTGMLGSMLVDVLSREEDLRVFASAHERSHGEWTPGNPADKVWKPGDVRWFRLVPPVHFPPSLQLGPGDWIVNAAGLIIHRIDTSDWRSVQKAVLANAALPYMLAEYAEGTGARVLQIATDCVFFGKGSLKPHCEEADHDEQHVYGRTKSLGEVSAPWFHNLRCSIVGFEAAGSVSLLEWFLSQPEGTTVKGYANHLWNGLTTLAFAKVVRAIVKQDLELPGLLHLVPGGVKTKHQLLCLFQQAFGRGDLTVEKFDHPRRVNRILGTNFPEKVGALWNAAGYLGPPSIENMLNELAQFPCRFRNWREAM